MKRPLAYVAGTGRGLPASVITNHDFAAIGIETTHDWIVERSGIHERRIARNGESTCSMAVEAARKAMQRAGTAAGDIDTIILSTATPRSTSGPRVRVGSTDWRWVRACWPVGLRKP